MSKSPSRGDGKPIGTPMDAKSPFHAGVTMGPDQIERMEALRRLRNRAFKGIEKNERAERRALRTEASFYDYKKFRKRAMEMRRSLAKGRTIAWIAERWNCSQDDVFAAIKWSEQRTARNKREKAGKKRGRVRREQLGAATGVEPSA